MNDDIMNECRDLCAQAYLKRVGAQSLPAGFDPTIIVTIITMLLELCKKPASELKAICPYPSWAHRVQVESVTRMALRRRHGLFAYGKYRGDAIVDAIFEVGSTAPVEKIDAFCECCCCV